MENLTIVTFVTAGELPNAYIVELAESLASFLKVNVDILLYSDRNLTVDNVKVVTSLKTTKYKRIMHALELCRSKYILCIDNDITPDKAAVSAFVQRVAAGSHDLAWGKIRADESVRIIANLVDIEKRLSHDFIRPFLWQNGLGISLPGQVFMINAETFRNALPDVDTVYDDLMIGLCARLNNFRYLYSSDVLGYEKPKVTLYGLIRQRIRWAKGLAEIIRFTHHTEGLKYVLLHAFCFNLLWLPFYVVMLSVLLYCPAVSVLLYVVYILFLSKLRPERVPVSIIYTLVFPAVYMIWLAAAIGYYLRIKKGRFG